MDDVVRVRTGEAAPTRQRLDAFTGICGRTAGATGLSLSLVVVPPGAVSAPHYHDGYETAIYQLSGRVETRYGSSLERAVVTEAGDFLFVPPGIPHQARNLSDVEPASAIIARSDADDQERVVPYEPRDG